MIPFFFFDNVCWLSLFLVDRELVIDNESIRRRNNSTLINYTAGDEHPSPLRRIVIQSRILLISTASTQSNS